MSGSDSIPATLDELQSDRDLGGPTSDYDSASAPIHDPSEPPLDKSECRPSLHCVSEPHHSEPHHNINPNSAARCIQGRARNSVSPDSPFAAGNSVGTTERALALYHHRMHKRMKRRSSSSAAPAQPRSVAGHNGLTDTLRIPPCMRHHGLANANPLASGPPLSQRRAIGLDIGVHLPEQSGTSSVSGFKLSDITGKPGEGNANSFGQGSKFDDFKQYVDAEKGWITFDGTATITGTGINFANGQTFSISLDEVDRLAELGKGKYGTVYMVRHAKPSVPRIGQGPSELYLKHPHSEPAPMRPVDDATDAGTTTGKVMAMKEIRLELDDAQFTTILKELVILHECVSPYIIDFYGAFFQEGAVYICIEYMDGGSVDKLYHGGIPESILRKIAYSTVMGLKSLKDNHSIIHRDVKPTNVLVNTKGQIKICDFGISGNLVASRAKTDIGCQSYMAPERISIGAMAQSGNADRTYNVKSDIWSLGLTLVECALGRYPYPREESSTIFSQLSAIVEGDPPDLPSGRYSEAARDFVRGCLQKAPKKRPTYGTLLQHPWLKSLSKPDIITEEDEVVEEAERVAEAVGKMQLGGSEDAEVANWVKMVLKRKHAGPGGDWASAGSLDPVSPSGSPLLQKGT